MQDFNTSYSNREGSAKKKKKTNPSTVRILLISHFVQFLPITRPEGTKKGCTSVRKKRGLRDDNKRAVTVGVNIYAIDFKGQILCVLVCFFFSHLQAETRAADVRESHSCEVRLEKRKLEGVCNEHLSTLGGWGGRTN